MKPPNILFLMTDQHRADALGFAGSPLVETPVLDRLARDAVIFERAYTPSPICIPARQCLAAGALPMTCGVRRYGQDLPPNAPTFARALASSGYNTVCAGKLHHIGPDQMQGWTQRLGWADMHVYPEHVPDRDPELFASRRGGEPAGWSLDRELAMSGVGVSPFRSNDEVTLDSALRFIDEYFTSPFYGRSYAHQPLLLKVSLQQPHYPFVVPEAELKPWLDRVPVFSGDGAHDHRCVRDWKWRPQADPGQVRLATAAYYAMIAWCDRAFGQVVERLAANGQDLDDWLVIFTSDHGEMLGEKGLWWKLSFYEGSVRVPLLIRHPRAFGHRRVRQAVSLCDLYATMCAAAGARIPDGAARDSRSLLPLCRGDDAGWNDEAVSEYGTCNLMIQRGPLKYQRLGGGACELLFDLDRDPQETTDRSTDTALAPVMAEFRHRAATLGHGG